jgi:hypothetical protein
MLHLRARSGARFRVLASLLTAGLAVGLAASTVPAASAKAPSTSKIYFGAAGDWQAASNRTGSDLAKHAYGFFENKSVPVAQMITVRFKDQQWRTTANLKSSSADYQDIVRWADALKSRGEVLVAFHGEPENSNNTKYGSAADFVAAYRKVVDIFKAEGATNVSFTWQMTAYAFSLTGNEYNAAASWYPGNAYVDVVGADPYNWYTCGHGKGKWNSLQTLASGAVSFAKSHGKQVALPEFASTRDSRRPAWIRDAGAYLAANDDVFVAAYYFNRAPTNSYNADCDWGLTTDADYSALKSVADGASFKS